MKSFKFVITIVAAVLFGVALGAFLTRPPQVKAAATVYLDKVTKGPNVVVGSVIVGFGCTQEDCYVASR